MRLDDLFDYVQSQANALVVVLRRTHQLAEACEQFGELVRCDAHPCVTHLKSE
eukprot:CAMPEP_0185598994 /NCGR_PEP_ID=MMETSP0434-20130131/82389_1 /TAXON_ID=626734 ORGANISM="Favella taraikaensis, Strain Fe Narragansett Bay" /NCGR_SAMPLE_ID=MMETSP0434 /ASSEMBLY_ACC=CAM_ASM_000379 /LENGTH=52 /DNA_ID=CAMNT_0028228205 /DNA_START=984 /DNA_END=1142 /DNA_ORIENTATION=-